MGARLKGFFALAVAVAVGAAAGRARAEPPAIVPVEISATQTGADILVRGRGRKFPCGELAGSF
jgi:hypothetical protein